MYRVALILAVLAAIGSLALSFTVTKPKIEGLVQERTELQTNLAASEAAKTEAEKKAKAAVATADKKSSERPLRLSRPAPTSTSPNTTRPWPIRTPRRSSWLSGPAPA
jgi:hypothetical protein